MTGDVTEQRPTDLSQVVEDGWGKVTASRTSPTPTRGQRATRTGSSPRFRLWNVLRFVALRQVPSDHSSCKMGNCDLRAAGT
ncbi:hypothetical protein DPMN_062015 [Dreissena polymorpha]|uniref:Uncharacterized protein n=1 Tax=Dreissena polymorpha TaxID=45954 RepID=A0A9D4HIY8_DREPO|nr:hypothetical protein DPMN_062010 [Dreissena polymorpha]KAH3719183.1 hypothetical protein DPMN_062015 [Dreissena polymorpha]